MVQENLNITAHILMSILRSNLHKQEQNTSLCSMRTKNSASSTRRH